MPLFLSLGKQHVNMRAPSQATTGYFLTMAWLAEDSGTLLHPWLVTSLTAAPTLCMKASISEIKSGASRFRNIRLG
jgi:hypothetical protein